MSAVMFIVWHYNYFGLYKVIHGYLCSVFFYEGKDIYFTIHAPEKPERPLAAIVGILADLCRKSGLPTLQIKFVEERFLPEYKPLGPTNIVYSDDNSEYAYKVSDLLDLSGPVNYYKRKRVKKIAAMADISLRPITAENIRLCAEIETEWCAYQDCAYCESFTGCEKKAIEAFFDLFDEKIHKGLFLYLGEKPIGYIICEKISEKLGVLYFGKVNIQDGFVYLIYMMFKEHLTDVEYMNISEDMGHQGLRRFKRLLSAYELWRKYIVTFDVKDMKQWK
ncbi:MAG: phosphatidylglycerol lysyltransferase domain-containing protein [Treponema sp.]|jgi:hypothetical protein|nr:phosphatidylglycerol lysyltransferase domain-containing protein [Treponema sp.]